MDLVRDVLDKQVVDRNGREMGRVDAIVLEARPGKPPLVRAIEIGPEVLARRLHPALGGLAVTIEEILGVADRRPIRIPFTQVDVRARVVADVTVGETGAGNVENRVRAEVRVEVRLEHLLGHPVVAADGRRVGRIEEFRAHKEGQGWAVTDFVIGPAGLWERLDVGARMVVGRQARGYIAHWDQLNFEDQGRVRLTCPVEELKRL